jgi:two-component system chemotaxis response regulator CheB
MNPKIRVLVTDDSSLMRKAVSDVLARDPDIEVVGVAANGKIALQKIPQVNPDLITLDLEMPEMDGLTALKLVRAQYPLVKVIICSKLSERGAQITLDALALGAIDYVTKPNGSTPQESLEKLAEQLLPKVRVLLRPPAFGDRSAGLATLVARRPIVPASKTSSLKIVCIGSSTGGPNALADVFSSFQAPLPVPIVLVQHMPPLFTAMLAQRLNKLNCGTTFHEGATDMPVQAGHAYIAPGGFHMEVRMKEGRPVVRLHEGTPENSCRPAVDVLFRSVAETYLGNALAVILTGMGSDGRRGCEQLAPLGARILAQDEATSVVWGMPGAVTRAGLPDEVVPLPQMGRRILDTVQRYTSTPASRALRAA